jgi:hypothetical protein
VQRELRVGLVLGAVERRVHGGRDADVHGRLRQRHADVQRELRVGFVLGAVERRVHARRHWIMHRRMWFDGNPHVHGGVQLGLVHAAYRDM